MSLPLASADLPGIGGRIKEGPADFVVEEVALYEPSGSGEHIYVRHRRSGVTTQDLAHKLARTFGLRPFDVGIAGLKDKVAVAEQTFSLPLPKADVDEVVRQVSAELPGEVVWARRHGNKLRRGHLLGNRFAVLVRDVDASTLDAARAIGARLEAFGVPNFYGEQRLGDDGRNVEKGRERLRDDRRDWLSNLHRTAWQADLYNQWLVDRIAAGTSAVLLAGDVAKRLDNGALFDVEDAAAETARAERREITPSGPLFGSDMRRARLEPAEHEDRLLAASGITWEELECSRLLGSRRAARVALAEFTAEAAEDGLWLRFRLPKGSYATVVLREFTR
ncbi:MAG: tRNA pseudouridine(13) synthase TruD [Planctomycetota bacterium]|nr:tRNA pseudouridine(13) synthase TruD [Planctomycetota bacterium]